MAFVFFYLLCGLSEIGKWWQTTNLCSNDWLGNCEKFAVDWHGSWHIWWDGGGVLDQAFERVTKLMNERDRESYDTARAELLERHE